MMAFPAVLLDLVQETVEFSGPPVKNLLIIRAYLIGMMVLASMIVLRFHIDREFANPVWYGLGLLAGIFFVIATGVFGYNYPYPGLILSVGLSLIMFAIGIAVGRIIWGPSNLIDPLKKEGQS